MDKPNRHSEITLLLSIINCIKLGCQALLYEVSEEERESQGTNHCHLQKATWQSKNEVHSSGHTPLSCYKYAECLCQAAQ